jgi:hypothetical protein
VSFHGSISDFPVRRLFESPGAALVLDSRPPCASSGPRDRRFEERAAAGDRISGGCGRQDFGDLRVRVRSVALSRSEPDQRADSDRPMNTAGLLRRSARPSPRLSPASSSSALLRLRQYVSPLPGRLPLGVPTQGIWRNRSGALAAGAAGRRYACGYTGCPLRRPSPEPADAL